MSDETHEVMPPEDLHHFARSLAALAPHGPAKSRDQLLFEAGKISVRQPMTWLWQTSAGGFAFLSLVLGLFLLWPGEPRVIERERIVFRTVEITPPPKEEPEISPSPLPTVPEEHFVSLPVDSRSEDAKKMLQVRNEVLRWGVDMLPRETAASSMIRTPKTDQELAEWLQMPRGTFAVPPNRTRLKKSEEE